jgi:hypothetical protein
MSGKGGPRGNRGEEFSTRATTQKIGGNDNLTRGYFRQGKRRKTDEKQIRVWENKLGEIFVICSYSDKFSKEQPAEWEDDGTIYGGLLRSKTPEGNAKFACIKADFPIFSDDATWANAMYYWQYTGDVVENSKDLARGLQNHYLCRETVKGITRVLCAVEDLGTKPLVFHLTTSAILDLWKDRQAVRGLSPEDLFGEGATQGAQEMIDARTKHRESCNEAL